MEREEAKTLISPATAAWLDLVKVLFNNKTPKCKRQVAYVIEKPPKADLIIDSFRTTTPSQKQHETSSSGLSQQQVALTAQKDETLWLWEEKVQWYKTWHGGGCQ